MDLALKARLRAALQSRTFPTTQAGIDQFWADLEAVIEGDDSVG